MTINDNDNYRLNDDIHNDNCKLNNDNVDNNWRLNVCISVLDAFYASFFKH